MKDFGYCDEGYARLASAIIMQALKDYRRLSGTEETNPEKAEIVDWILHGNFGDITDLELWRYYRPGPGGGGGAVTEGGCGQMQNAVGFLSQARHIDVQINSKLEELYSLKAMAEKVTTTYQSDMVDGSRDVHKREGIICKIIDLQNEINSDIDQLVDLKISIRQIIESLPDMEGRTVLNLRYVRLLKWQEVADTMGYSLRRVHNFHDRAIQYLESEIE